MSFFLFSPYFVLLKIFISYLPHIGDGKNFVEVSGSCAEDKGSLLLRRVGSCSQFTVIAYNIQDMLLYELKVCVEGKRNCMLGQ